MKAQLDSCDPARLHLLAEDLLPPAELARLEQHLEACAWCRQTLDCLVESDGCLTAARRHLGDDLTGPFATCDGARSRSTSSRRPTGPTRWAGSAITR